MEYVYQYGLFVAQTVTIVIAIAVVVGLIVGAASRNQHHEHKGHIEVTKLNDRYEELADAIRGTVLDQHFLKQEQKNRKKAAKQESKQAKKNAKAKASGEPAAETIASRKKRVYVIDFNGDIKASATDDMRQCITAILTMAEPKDEVVLKLESPGGMVHSYGLAASQLARITKAEIPLTVTVDKVAASGGYMMACVGDKIVAAPFAIIGSIGVVAQLPNFHRLLKKHEVDYEMLTAGEYKRTLTMFGENTDKGRQKFQEDLEDTHVLFKDFIRSNREQVAVDDVATGEIWFGQRALEKHLIDDVKTSDEYLVDACNDADVYAVEYKHKKSLPERVGLHTEAAFERILGNLWQKARLRFLS